MKSITVVSVIENDQGLADLMIRSVLKFTHPTVKFIFCDNSNGKNEARIKKSLCDYKNYKIIKSRPTMGGGSNRHGEGLNKIFKSCNIDTKYTAIIESDVIVLADDWYKIKSGYKVKGAEKIEHLYHACFFVFETELLKKMDWRAGKNDSDRISGKSYLPKHDVGWQISEKINKSFVEVIQFKDCKDGDQTFGRTQSDAFYCGGKLIAGHFGRGSNISGKAVRKTFKHPTEQMSDWKKIAEGILK